jgi:hypothetical protein
MSPSSLCRILAVAVTLGAISSWGASAGARAGMRQPAFGRNLALSCSNPKGSISPCSSSVTVPAGSTGNQVVFVLAHSGSGYVEGGISCAKSGSVSTCSVNNTIYELTGVSSLTDTVTFSAFTTAGTGSVTINGSGLIGSLASNVTVTVSQVSACLPSDRTSTTLLNSLYSYATGNEYWAVGFRARAKLPRLPADGLGVTQVTSGPECASAASAFNAHQKQIDPNRDNPNRRVYLFKWNSSSVWYLVSDPTVQAGEWTVVTVFASDFSFVSSPLM